MIASIIFGNSYSHPKGWHLSCRFYVNGMKPTEWATQFILTPQELEEYKKTHSVK